MKDNKTEFFEYFCFSPLELDELYERCEGLKIASVERMSKCAFELMKIGLDKNDVYELILINPTILLKDPTSFADELKNLGSNAKEQIKNDPFII